MNIFKTTFINDRAVFELYFRKNPFKGEYTIFAGLSDCLNFLKNFKFTHSDISYLKSKLPNAEPEFWTYLLDLNTNDLVIDALSEGSLCFPRVPLLILEGPLLLLQIIETPLLNMINFASLIATNASRMRFAAGEKSKLLEFGLRRAQGPNGGLTASKYAILGGFDASSNVLAGKIFDIPISGTHSHSYVNSFTCTESNNGNCKLANGFDILKAAREVRPEILQIIDTHHKQPRESELLAFATYAATFPDQCLCLLDTYDTLGSGVPNFLAVAAALKKAGHSCRGVRIDSGDLAYLSTEIRQAFVHCEKTDPEKFAGFSKMQITASNNINEETLYALQDQQHSIDAFGIGTHLVTCQAQPALGCVYKLVKLNGEARMKLTEDVTKITMPGRKKAFRLYNGKQEPLVDVMMRLDEEDPVAGKKFLLQKNFQKISFFYD